MWGDDSVLRVPGEIFRALKEKEVEQFGEYCAPRLVSVIWGRVEKD